MGVVGTSDRQKTTGRGSTGVTRLLPGGPGTGLLGSLRIRKKLMVLHTGFSVALALVLIVALGPMLRELVRLAEQDESRRAMTMFVESPWRVEELSAQGVVMQYGAPSMLGLGEVEIADVTRDEDFEVETYDARRGARIVRYDAASGNFFLVESRSTRMRSMVLRIYGLLVIILIGMYAFIVLMLEVFVLPRQVYQPIRRLLRADAAVRGELREDELIEDELIPADELGLIMRSRNNSIRRLRDKEEQLSGTLERLEEVADDLKRKNFLLETAKQQMAEHDRLVSLGIMSAGLAHELNTPLTVLKGSVERLASSPDHSVDEKTAQLMLRVVKRLEHLSESLLDVARVRSLGQEPVGMRELVDEAWALVRLDRQAVGIEFVNTIDASCSVVGDADRLAQVFLNLIRNSVDALGESGRIEVSASELEREGSEWLSVHVTDNGPGIDHTLLPRIFEPFTSTRLDAKGTGLGLAVSEGIVREHGGLLLARNRKEGGAGIEVLLPLKGRGRLDEHVEQEISHE
ncbi:MAG: sensor histidine kinase [Phycisphaerales bacterium JB043]